MGNPEQDARRQIDRLLVQAGWHVCDADQTNITAHRGVAIREFPLPGHGFADYLLYVDGRAAALAPGIRLSPAGDLGGLVGHIGPGQRRQKAPAYVKAVEVSYSCAPSNPAPSSSR